MLVSAPVAVAVLLVLLVVLPRRVLVEGMLLPQILTAMRPQIPKAMKKVAKTPQLGRASLVASADLLLRVRSVVVLSLQTRKPGRWRMLGRLRILGRLRMLGRLRVPRRELVPGMSSMTTTTTTTTTYSIRMRER
jgi:hypothetical protein